MSRDNSKRLGDHPSSPLPPKRVTEVPHHTGFQNSQNSSVLDIAANLPPDSVILPSAGRFYDETSTLHGKTEIEIKQLTAREEDILSSPELIKKGVVFDKLLESVIIDKTINPRDLLLGDRNAILLKSRINAYGADYSVNMQCSNCGKVTQHDFDLTKCNFEFEHPDIEGLEAIPGGYSLKLPKTGVTVNLKLLTVSDSMFLAEQERLKKKNGLESSPVIDFLQRVVVSADGHTGDLLNRFLQVLPAYDTRKIRTTYSKIIPDVQTKQTVQCSSCSWESEKEVWFELNFFWPDI